MKKWFRRKNVERQRNWREARQLILVKTLQSGSRDSWMFADHFGLWHVNFDAILRAQKGTFVRSRLTLFWSFRAQFWLRGILRFLNETLVDCGIFWKCSSATCRLHYENGNILKPTQDASRIFDEPTKFCVIGFSDCSALWWWAYCLSYYRIVTFAL